VVVERRCRGRYVGGTGVGGTGVGGAGVGGYRQSISKAIDVLMRASLLASTYSGHCHT
jgi:hypothetical protein